MGKAAGNSVENATGDTSGECFVLQGMLFEGFLLCFAVGDTVGNAVGYSRKQPWYMP